MIGTGRGGLSITNRWTILALLFACRTVMAFQYQSIAALSPILIETQGFSLADIGILVGLYLAPGIALAYPGGALGAALGDHRAVAFGMVLMIAGGAVVAFFPGYEAQIIGRVVAGIGGTILNVIMSKMVTDWFAGREIATAMAIYVNSWPVGIALALVALPTIAIATSVAAAGWGLVAGLIVALAALLLLYRPPPGAASASLGRNARPEGPVLQATLLAGGVWGLYNGGMAMMFAFGPALLAGKGYGPEAASATASLALFAVAISVPIGGILADRTGRKDAIIAVGLLGGGGMLVLLPALSADLLTFPIAGLFAGIAAGPVMSLASEALVRPEHRAKGMGLFFTVFYISVVTGPIVAGWLATATGSPSAPFVLGLLMEVAGLAALFAFRRTLARIA